MVDSGPVTPAQRLWSPFPLRLTLPTLMRSASSFAAALTPGRVVIADMTATTFCDTPGARMLVLAWRRAIAHGTELRLLLPNPAVMRIIKLQGLDAVLPIYHSLEEALPGDSPAASVD